MSTFDGLVHEFPDIRIDFFRQHANQPPPLACFLSHVHSDHLAGLETLRSPFVYCSAPTREILLRLERYPCRINYARGILETSRQTYGHLAKVLKPLPMEASTILELQPGHRIQVTLFNANHCPGAVMFLIEGGGKAILYTGDIRCEPWFVNAFARNPSVIAYTHGQRRLDKLYLDTSFLEDVPLQTKAQGLAELFSKVAKYPDDTIFHFQAWTYGYEEVWVALSNILGSLVHVDDYKMKIYNSLRLRISGSGLKTDVYLAPEAPALTGYMCGNAPYPGCLTTLPDVRLHSCERGNMCSVAQQPSVVAIQPIVAHTTSDGDLIEAGVGGGGEDLEREAKLDFASPEELDALLKMLRLLSTLQDDLKENTKEFNAEVLQKLAHAAARSGSLPTGLDLASVDEKQIPDLMGVLQAVRKKATEARIAHNCSQSDPDQQSSELPKVIYFPFARHSSYQELCHLVSTLKPKDIWPCTVKKETWRRNAWSMESLFGQYCSGSIFEHDIQMRQEFQEKERHITMTEHEIQDGETQTRDSQRLNSSELKLDISVVQKAASQDPDPDHALTQPSNHAESLEELPQSRCSSPPPETQATRCQAATTSHQIVVTEYEDHAGDSLQNAATNSRKRSFGNYADKDLGLLEEEFRDSQRVTLEIPDDAELQETDVDAGDSQVTEASVASKVSTHDSVTRQRAYLRMLQNLDGDEWHAITLLSTDGGHTIADKEL